MKTADPELMRTINRFYVLDTIRRHGPLARITICELTQLSPTTVSAITGTLIESGLIEPLSLGDLRNGGGRGRPRVMLQLKATAACVIGVKVSCSRLHFVLTDFQGDLLAEYAMPVRLARETLDVLSYLIEDGVRTCLAKADRGLDELDGLSVAIPGIVEFGTGCVRESPLLAQTDAPLSQALHQRLGVLALVESDTNAISQGVHWFGAARDVDDFVLVSLEHTIGLSIMHRGQLFRGGLGLSPNLGDLVVSAPGVSPIVKLSALTEQDAVTPEAEKLAKPRGRAAGAVEPADHDADQHDTDQHDKARLAGESLGHVIANIVTLLAPRRILLVGSMIGLGEPLLGPLRRAIKAAVPPALANHWSVEVHEPDDGLWARGAAALALREIYGAPWGSSGPALPLLRTDQQGVRHDG